MKKSLLALAISAATFTGAASAAEIYSNDGGSVDFYGQLRTEMTFEDSNSHNGDLKTGSSRVGVDAKYDVTDNFAVLGLVELGVPANKTNDVEVRRHLIGFATDFGTVQFGRDWTTSDDLGGTDYSYFFGGSGNLYDTLNGALHDSQVKYSLDLENFWVKASYGFNDDTSQKNDLTELFVGTSFGDLSLRAGAGYNRNHAYEGLDLSNTFYEATAIYDATENLQLSATYYGSKIENEDGNGDVERNAVSVGGYWTFIEKTSLYGGYEFVKHEPSNDANYTLSEDGTNIFGGLEYKFSSWARVFAEVGYSDGATLGFVDPNDNFIHAQEVDKETNFGLGARFYW